MADMGAGAERQRQGPSALSAAPLPAPLSGPRFVPKYRGPQQPVSLPSQSISLP